MTEGLSTKKGHSDLTLEPLNNIFLKVTTWLTKKKTYLGHIMNLTLVTISVAVVISQRLIVLFEIVN